MTYATQNAIDYQRMIERVREHPDSSQSGEQTAIIEALTACDPFGDWRFLDIGAGDGESFSNTRALALAGWGGVCVEPAAWAFSRLADLYLHRERAAQAIRCCQAVVTAEQRGLMTFLYAKDDHLSTVEPAEAEKWRRVVDFQSLTVAAVTIAEVLDWFELGASVVSIDAEGRTNEIVRAYMRHPAWQQVEVICYERENWASRGATHLTLPFELVAETSNNLIYRRQR